MGPASSWRVQPSGFPSPSLPSPLWAPFLVLHHRPRYSLERSARGERRRTSLECQEEKGSGCDARSEWRALLTRVAAVSAVRQKGASSRSLFSVAGAMWPVSAGQGERDTHLSELFRPGGGEQCQSFYESPV